MNKIHSVQCPKTYIYRARGSCGVFLSNLSYCFLKNIFINFLVISYSVPWPLLLPLQTPPPSYFHFLSYLFVYRRDSHSWCPDLWFLPSFCSLSMKFPEPLVRGCVVKVLTGGRYPIVSWFLHLDQLWLSVMVSLLGFYRATTLTEWINR